MAFFCIGSLGVIMHAVYRTALALQRLNRISLYLSLIAFFALCGIAYGFKNPGIAFTVAFLSVAPARLVFVIWRKKTKPFLYTLLLASAAVPSAFTLYLIANLAFQNPTIFVRLL